MAHATFTDALRQNYQSLLIMIEGSIHQCSDDLWSSKNLKPRFWQEVYHTLYYMDFYLGDDYDSYQPRFDIEENLNKVPQATLSKDDLQVFVTELKEKCNSYFTSLSASDLEEKNSHPWTGKTHSHKLLYNLRHSTHHMGKLSSLLKQQEISPARWVTSPEE